MRSPTTDGEPNRRSAGYSLNVNTNDVPVSLTCVAAPLLLVPTTRQSKMLAAMQALIDILRAGDQVSSFAAWTDLRIDDGGQRVGLVRRFHQQLNLPQCLSPFLVDEVDRPRFRCRRSDQRHLETALSWFGHA